jgi:hypothetical protein
MPRSSLGEDAQFTSSEHTPHLQLIGSEGFDVDRIVLLPLRPRRGFLGQVTEGPGEGFWARHGLEWSDHLDGVGGSEVFWLCQLAQEHQASSACQEPAATLQGPDPARASMPASAFRTVSRCTWPLRQFVDHRDACPEATPPGGSGSAGCTAAGDRGGWQHPDSG